MFVSTKLFELLDCR